MISRLFRVFPPNLEFRDGPALGCQGTRGQGCGDNSAIILQGIPAQNDESWKQAETN